MTDRVRKILSCYQSENPGVLAIWPDCTIADGPSGTERMYKICTERFLWRGSSALHHGQHDDESIDLS